MVEGQKNKQHLRSKVIAASFVTSLLPFVLWIGGLLCWIVFRWPPLTCLVCMLVAFVLGSWITFQTPRWMYAMGRKFLPTGLKGIPVTDYLVFEWEELATIEKLKIYGDDFGCVYKTDVGLEFSTLEREATVPRGSLIIEEALANGKVVGLRLASSEGPIAGLEKGVFRMKYIGPELAKSHPYTFRNSWASDILRRWESKTPPELPARFSEGLAGKIQLP